MLMHEKTCVIPIFDFINQRSQFNEILVNIAYAICYSLNMHAQLPTSQNCLPESFGCASSKGSVEIVRMPRII